MDLSAFQAADNAVKKLLKDYSPVVNLSEALDKVRKVLESQGDLEAKKAALEAEVRKLTAERASVEAELAKVRSAVARAESVYSEIKAKLAAFKG
jgi:predicted  nucleic acid-binding Zn-ribbon protein